MIFRVSDQRVKALPSIPRTSWAGNHDEAKPASLLLNRWICSLDCLPVIPRLSVLVFSKIAAKVASFLGHSSVACLSLANGIVAHDTISRDLSGPGETYYTEDNTPMNYDVEGFFNTTVTRNYLGRLQVPYGRRNPAPAHEDYVTLNTGQKTEYPPGQL
ncbi:hypothetical protein BDV32DRAFT_145517 [Aspergillus pseudonomiae]|uniref:Uncharacterized protein n=1 Tax=Aspergillus pseudonomiae TaxID=1506151 RepID=A0A5N6ID06_9EURO|nr:uncharacterized protein BDV37DRAFT_278089 [Aspergillus pseudonomiae]KAB8264266.1 hypothetical protein BDV32DRAFT_145517 [Aspergillus pseudonomiae]KAE8409113.1 hypothetical protein BDV37DRAFT_278089 [Aspergillus pseudonomiae]